MRLSTRLFIAWHCRPGHSPGFTFHRIGRITVMSCIGCGRHTLVLPGDSS